MTPGPILSLLSHECPGSPITRENLDDWGRTILLLWTITGFITGGALIDGIGRADHIITTASSDGSVMSTSKYLSGDSIISSRLFGSGLTSIDRETETQDPPITRLQAQSEGPLLIGEYASVEQKTRDHPLVCVFGNRSDRSERSEIETSGILQHGTYSSMRTLQAFESTTAANGTGILDLRHQVTGNETISGRTLATGNLSVYEDITGDQGDTP